MDANEIEAERDWCLAVLAGLAQLDEPAATRTMARQLVGWERLLRWARPGKRNSPREAGLGRQALAGKGRAGN